MSSVVDEKWRKSELNLLSVASTRVIRVKSEATTQTDLHAYRLNRSSCSSGAFCVWLTKAPKEMSWLNGRFLSAEGNVDKLNRVKEAIVKNTCSRRA